MKTLKSALIRLLLLSMAGLAPVIALAAEESVGKFNGVLVLCLTAAQVVGLIFLWTGISKIRKDKEQPGQGLMGQGLLSCVSAVVLYFLPRLMGMGEATLFP